MISVSWNNASVIEGRISDFRPESERNPVCQNPISTRSPRPDDGNHRRFTAKTRISSRPVTKVGIEMPTSVADWVSREKKACGFSAQSTPSGMPSDSASTVATITSSSVAGRRLSNRVVTGCW
ncbi:hypothetical protein D9M72_522580 [compost metagenome]